MTAAIAEEVFKLYDLLGKDGQMRFIREGLENEWGPFAPADMNEMYRMVENAGQMIYVLRRPGPDGLFIPISVFQTGRADVQGNYRNLIEIYTSFNHIIGHGTWSGANEMKGDTVLALQITTLVEDDRSQGAGSSLRKKALGGLPPEVLYGLTMTPVDYEKDAEDIQKGSDSYPPAMKFHSRGGSEFAGCVLGYKRPDLFRPNTGKGRPHGEDIAFMRYIRGTGIWENPKTF